MSDKDTVFARILELAITADEGDDTVQVTAINFARGRQKFAASDVVSVPFSGGAAAANCEVELGGVFPAPSVIRLTSTFQA